MIELYCEMDTKNVIRLLDTEKEVFAVVPTSIQKYKDGSFKVFFQYEYDNIEEVMSLRFMESFMIVGMEHIVLKTLTMMVWTSIISCMI